MTFLLDILHVLVKTSPPKSGVSRAPLDLRRPRGAATSHPHSSTTTCRRKNGSRRGGSVEIALPGTARFPPPAFSSSLPAIFFFRTPTILNFRIAFWPLDPCETTSPIRTAALRHAGGRTGVGAPPRRGGSVEIALLGTARLPPPAFSSSLPAICFFPTPTILIFELLFGHFLAT